MKKIFAGILMALMVLCWQGKSYAADQWAKGEPAGTRAVSDIDAYVGTNNEALDRLVGKYRRGATIAYASAATITVGVGEVACDNAGGTVRRWRQNTSATTVTWADIDAGGEAGTTTYYLYAVADTDATTFTVTISTSSTAPAGKTYYRRLGSFYNDASSNIDQFEIANDDVILDWNAIESKLNMYDSGWFAVATGTAYSKTHNLGTIEFLALIFFSTDSAGADAEIDVVDSSVDYHSGMQLKTITTTTCVLQTATKVHKGLDATGAPVYYASGYARIILLATD